MYQVGDLILYGNTGVCKIEDITTKELPGTVRGQLFYKLIPLYQSGVIFTPVENNKVFMRHIIGREEAERLIALIPSIQAEAYHSPVIKELTSHYETSMQTHDCQDLIELTMSLYAKKKEVALQRRKFGAVDDRFMRRAEDLLFGELAAALSIEKEDVPAYISAKVDIQNT